MSDPAIERLEAELRDSRFKPWDVETFLAKRHQAKIEALTAPEDKWQRRGQAFREACSALAALVGYVAIMASAGSWLLTGHLPFDRPAPIVFSPIPVQVCPPTPLPSEPVGKLTPIP